MELRTFLRVSLPFASVGFINQASRIVVATLGPAMALEFGLSASGLGALAAVFFAAYALSQLPVGLAIDSTGRGRSRSRCRWSRHSASSCVPWRRTRSGSASAASSRASASPAR